MWKVFELMGTVRLHWLKLPATNASLPGIWVNIGEAEGIEGPSSKVHRRSRRDEKTKFVCSWREDISPALERAYQTCRAFSARIASAAAVGRRQSEQDEKPALGAANLARRGRRQMVPPSRCLGSVVGLCAQYPPAFEGTAFRCPHRSVAVWFSCSLA